MEDRLERLEEKIQRHEERMTKIEISQAETTVELKNISGKQDQVLQLVQKIEGQFVSRGACDALQSQIKNDVDRIGDKCRDTMKSFNDHIKEHWSKSDRMATWLTTTLVGVFIIGKIAKVW